METISLKEFTEKELRNDIESGFAFLIGDSIEEDVKKSLSNPDSALQIWERMKKRYSKLQEMGMVSGVYVDEKNKQITHE